MCLAVPAKITALDNDMDATVDIEGVRRNIKVAFIDNPKIGDYVLVHAGFAIRKWTKEDVEDYRQLTERFPATR